jgi:hypothetical protein
LLKQIQNTIRDIFKRFNKLPAYQKLIVGAIVFVLVAPGFMQSTGGYESIVANWNRVTWDEYTDTSGTVWPAYEKEFDVLTDTWDGNERYGVPSA